MLEPMKHNFRQAEAEIEKKRTLSDADLLRTGAHYEIDEQTGGKKLVATPEQIQKIHETVEIALVKEILTKEALGNGDIEINFEEEPIGYEFEVEKEQRIMVDASQFDVPKWVNHIVDTYDPSGRCRIRIKNGKPRLSLKVPLLSQDTETAKCCIRLEFKPRTNHQERELLKIQELISAEPETKKHEKWGAPLALTNGEEVWLNKDDEGNYWIETDESYDIESLLPEKISYLGHTKSAIKITQDIPRRENSMRVEPAAEYSPQFNDFQQRFLANIELLSRSAKGISDISVSGDKEKLDLEGEKLVEQIRKNIADLARYVLENKTKQFETANDVRELLNDMAGIANYKLSKKREPGAFRKHEVPYGRKIPPQEIGREIDIFCGNLLKKMREIEKGTLNPDDAARWAELEINKNIHPYADGCGKIAVGLSAFILARYGHILPHHKSREAYYNAMNAGEEEFAKYYSEALRA